jgi:hypothetical protein
MADVTKKQGVTSHDKNRQIVPVVRKVVMKNANDDDRDLDYWLAQPPVKRLEAVTFLVLQSLREGERMNKNVVTKRKMKP